MRKNKIIKICFFVILILSVILIYKYTNHKNYINSLKEDQAKLLNFHNSFGYNYFDIRPKNNEDLKVMLDWTRATSGESDLGLSFMKYGYGIVNDTISSSSLIYSFGKGNNDNGLKSTAFNDKDLDSLGQYSIRAKGFFKYLTTMFSDQDVILLKVKDPKFDCTQVIEGSKAEPFLKFELYNRDENLWMDENSKRKFLKLIGDFQRKHSNLENINSSNRKKIYIKYKNGEVDVLCNNGFDDKIASRIKTELKSFFSSVNDLFFNYAIFSIDLEEQYFN